MTTTTDIVTELCTHPLLLDDMSEGSDRVVSYNPATGEALGAVRLQSKDEYEDAVQRAQL
ncbi:MAG: hypothetical protein HOJ54_03735, partial [Phycisphaerae bacterium]|nr:hypothetical protein [Phycisphaerae bacterium]